ncbi:MAG: glycosyl hydrolase family 28-related protein [Acidobacteriota bacterium]|nr:glycosyl hydrolase family 28-related protein [Acidobacteriota bacterium]
MAIACSPAFTQNTERATSGDFSLRDFGADPSGIEDSSPAFARLMEAVGDRRQVRITIPPGTYRLASRVVLNAVGNAESYGMRIQGAGEDVTELRVDNPDGGLQFHGTHINRLSFTVSDLSMVAVRENAGVALAFDTANPGDHHSRQFNAENLLIRGERFDRGSFNAGIAVRNAWYPRLDNVKITSVYGPRPAESDPMEFAILLEDCYSPLVRGCYVWGARNGLAYRARDKQPEDGIVRDSYFVGCDTGVTVDLKADTAQWEEPAFHVETCHIAYRDRGVVLHGVRQANISHCLFYCSDRQGAAFHGGGPSRDFDPLDIDLSYASDVIIDGSIFTEPANPRRVAVRIGPDSGYAIIHGNQFNLEGTAVRNESKTASFVTGNVFGGRRDFSQGLRRYVDPIGTLVISDAAP